MTPQAYVAFFIWTAEKGYRIYPEYGFIPSGGYVYVTIEYQGNHEDVEEKLFFIKGLPLSYELDMPDMQKNINEVFHIYNRSILFTVHQSVGAFDLE